eukprot:7688733-Ditylum_brightwellii.AAC.1
MLPFVPNSRRKTRLSSLSDPAPLPDLLAAISPTAMPTLTPTLGPLAHPPTAPAPKLAEARSLLPVLTSLPGNILGPKMEIFIASKMVLGRPGAPSANLGAI